MVLEGVLKVVLEGALDERDTCDNAGVGGVLVDLLLNIDLKLSRSFLRCRHVQGGVVSRILKDNRSLFFKYTMTMALNIGYVEYQIQNTDSMILMGRM